MKIIPALLILGCGSVLAWTGAASGKPGAAAKPPYKVSITLPAGFAADDDPVMTSGAFYVFDHDNGDAAGTKASLRFLKHPRAKPLKTRAERAHLLAGDLAELRRGHHGYGESAAYEIATGQLTYTCADWHGTSFLGNDFAGFVCVASFGGEAILVEAQDLAANAGTTLPQLKDSLTAATYTKE